MENFIRQLRTAFLLPVGRRWPYAYGHVEQVDDKRIFIYIYLPPEELKHREEFLRFMDDLIRWEALTVRVLYKASGLTPTEEVFCTCFVETTPPLYCV